MNLNGNNFTFKVIEVNVLENGAELKLINQMT